MERQPIETAPRDGTRIRVYNAFVGWYETAFSDGPPGTEWPLTEWDGAEGLWWPVPTDWMPLPEPQEGK